MPLVKLPFTPGVNKEVTSYAETGTYFNADKIRFRSGFVEKIGGWTNAYPNATFNGVARTLLSWVSYDGYKLTAIGTNQRYYVQYGNAYNDITPVRTTSGALTNPFTTSGTTSLITVTATGHGAGTGSYVTITSTAPVGGYTVSGQYEIISVVDGNTFTINAYPTIPTAGTGGGTVNITYGINAGGGTVTSSNGWGAGVWGGVTGVSSTGWGQGALTAISIPLQLWSQCNFNQDLIFSSTSGAIYYWQYGTGGTTLSTSAVTLNAFAATQVKGTAVVTVGGTNVSQITVDNSFYITSGSTVTINTSSGTVPAGTYVTSAYSNGFVVTLSGNVTVSAGDILNFSYAGYSVPNQTNKVIGSSTLQFTICIGANPYDPTNFNTTFNPMIVRWSDQSNAYEWVPQTQNQSGETPLSNGSYLITAVNNRQEILVWSNTTLYSMQYVGPPLTFSFTILQDNVSIISPNAAVTINNITYWMGLDRFYVYSGSVQTLPCTLKRYIYSNINYAQQNQIVCGFNEAFNEIWWHYPSATSSVNDSYVIYNYLDNVWYPGTMNRTAWLDSQYQQYPMGVFSLQKTYLSGNITATTTQIQVLNSTTYPTSGTVTIDNEQISYSGVSVSNNTLNNCVRGINNTTAATHNIYAPVTYSVPNQIIWHENGQDDGTPATPLPIYSYIESTDVSLGDGHKFSYIWRIVPDVTFTNSTAANPVMYMTLEPRQDSGSAYTTSVGGFTTDVMSVANTALPVAPTYTYPVEQYTGQIYTRVRGRQMAVKYYSQDLGVMWQVGANRYDIRPDGRR